MSADNNNNNDMIIGQKPAKRSIFYHIQRLLTGKLCDPDTEDEKVIAYDDDFEPVSTSVGDRGGVVVAARSNGFDASSEKSAGATAAMVDAEMVLNKAAMPEEQDPIVEIEKDLELIRSLEESVDESNNLADVPVEEAQVEVSEEKLVEPPVEESEPIESLNESSEVEFTEVGNHADDIKESSLLCDTEVEIKTDVAKDTTSTISDPVEDEKLTEVKLIAKAVDKVQAEKPESFTTEPIENGSESSFLPDVKHDEQVKDSEKENLTKVTEEALVETISKEISSLPIVESKEAECIAKTENDLLSKDPTIGEPSLLDSADVSNEKKIEVETDSPLTENFKEKSMETNSISVQQENEKEVTIENLVEETVEVILDHSDDLIKAPPSEINLDNKNSTKMSTITIEEKSVDSQSRSALMIWRLIIFIILAASVERYLDVSNKALLDTSLDENSVPIETEEILDSSVISSSPAEDDIVVIQNEDTSFEEISVDDSESNTPPETEDTAQHEEIIDDIASLESDAINTIHEKVDVSTHHEVPESDGVPIDDQDSDILSTQSEETEQTEL